jgi:hypothetical protein
MVPSGKGIVPARKALMATALPKTAPRLLRFPSSWADEIHFQSRYPAGFSVTYGAAASSAFPDAGDIRAATPLIVATETNIKAILLIVAPFKMRLVFRCP